MSCEESWRKISFGSLSPESRISFNWASYRSPWEIAFCKIVGFDVTPTTASSRIICSSLPVCSRSRDRKSIQTLWPSADSLCRFESGMCHPSLHRFNLLQSSHISLAAVEPRPQERVDQVASQ